MNNRRSFILSTFAALLLTTGASSTAFGENYNPDLLKVALLPDENAATIIQDNEPLAEYLSMALGKEVELIVTTDYSSMIEAMRFGRIDIAYFGPASYTIAKDKMEGGEIDIEPFAARMKNGAATYQSVIIASIDSGIETFEDINGKNIDLAFGDPASTSSHYAPKYTLIKKGVQPGEYKEQFLGAHDAVAVNVSRGNAAVGGLSRPIFESLLEKGTIKPDDVKIVGYSEPIPQYPWVMRTDLTEELQSTIKSAFFDLKKELPEHQAILKPFKSDGFVEIADADYDIIRAIRNEVPE